MGLICKQRNSYQPGYIDQILPFLRKGRRLPMKMRQTGSDPKTKDNQHSAAITIKGGVCNLVATYMQAKEFIPTRDALIKFSDFFKWSAQPTATNDNAPNSICPPNKRQYTQCCNYNHRRSVKSCVYLLTSKWIHTDQWHIDKILRFLPTSQPRRWLM